MIFLYLILIIFTFYGLALIVDNFLVPSVYKLRDKFNWTDDQTGTIISFVSSAPELSVSAVSLFLAATTGGSQASMGPGTVIGSALFSILFIVGASSWFASKKLSWPAIIRDMGYYLLSVFAIYFVVIDSKVQMWESLLLLILFGLYAFIVSKWKNILKSCDEIWPSLNIEEQFIQDRLTAQKDNENQDKTSLKSDKWSIQNFVPKLFSYLFFGLSGSVNFGKNAWNIGLSIGFVVLFSTLMVNYAVSFANILNIPPVVISLTILAAGTSVPDLLASIKTAREGFGDTAIANAVGSNVFDILANLGLTWFIGSIISGNKALDVDTSNLQASIILLFAATGSLILVLFAKKWKLGKAVSIILMLSYVIYVTSEIIKAVG